MQLLDPQRLLIHWASPDAAVVRASPDAMPHASFFMLYNVRSTLVESFCVNFSPRLMNAYANWSGGQTDCARRADNHQSFFACLPDTTG